MAEYTYTIKFLKGLRNFVIDELKEKFADQYEIEKVNTSPVSITVNTAVEFIEEFRKLKSAIQISKDKRSIDLDKPLWRRSFVPAGVNPSLAYVMCKLSSVDNVSRIVDPFCGAGTIGLTAAFEFNARTVMMSDKSGTAIDACEQNLELVRAISAEQKRPLSHDLKAFRSDISRLNFGKQKFSHIITNPPFGVRVGSHENNIKIYRELEKLGSTCLSENGSITLISQEKQLTEDVFGKWKISQKLDLESGGLKLRVWRLLRP